MPMQTEPTITPTAEDICYVWRVDRRLSERHLFTFSGSSCSAPNAG